MWFQQLPFRNLSTSKSCHIFFKFSPKSSPKTDRAVCSNTVWAFRASFKIRRLRRLSRGSADPRELSPKLAASLKLPCPRCSKQRGLFSGVRLPRTNQGFPSAYSAQVPSTKISTSLPSSRIPTICRSSDPTIKSIWIIESLIPFA